MPTEQAMICVCGRCNHKWLPKSVLPARCAKCKSPVWNRTPKKPGRPLKGKPVNPLLWYLEAKAFQKPLDALAETIALKVQREGPKHSVKPIFVIPDIYYLLRHAHQTYNLFCFVNADERRRRDAGYRIAYSVVILPLVRTMIDCLYNITAILNNPGPRGYQFRESGLKQILRAVDADERRYGGNPTWDDSIARYRQFIDVNMRGTGITEDDVRTADLWPTLGQYLRPKKNMDLTAHQRFLKELTFGFWQEYSGISHATYPLKFNRCWKTRWSSLLLCMSHEPQAFCFAL